MLGTAVERRVESRRTQKQYSSPCPPLLLPRHSSQRSLRGKHCWEEHSSTTVQGIQQGGEGGGKEGGVDGQGHACYYLAHTLRVQSGLRGHLFPLLVPDLLVHGVQELPQPRARLLDPETANLPPRKSAGHRDSREGKRAATIPGGARQKIKKKGATSKNTPVSAEPALVPLFPCMGWRCERGGRGV